MFQIPQGVKSNRLASPSGNRQQINSNSNSSRSGTPTQNQSASKSGRLPRLLNDEKGNPENNGIDVGVCSLQGRRPYQEDQYAICRFLKDPTSQRENPPETHFFGVFDGHAGGKCSKAICTTIPYQLCRDESFITKLPLALRKAIQRTNEQFLEVAGRMRLNDGSTAVCVVLRGTMMTISNVGDSRAVLISGKKGIPLTEDHKPSTPSEQKRIASFGGTVTYNTGIARVAGVLAVSRAFGNYTIRNLIRADPDITERELSPQDDFIVIASDGLWDVFTANDVAEICHSWQKYGVNRIAEQLVQLAITRGSMDNVTAIVISLTKYYTRILTQQSSNPNPNSTTLQSASSSSSSNANNNIMNGNSQNLFQTETNTKRAATASSVLNATQRPDSSGGVGTTSGSGNGYGRQKNHFTEEKTDSYLNDESLLGDDGTIVDYDHSQYNSRGHSHSKRPPPTASRFGDMNETENHERKSASSSTSTPSLSSNDLNSKQFESSFTLNQFKKSNPSSSSILPKSNSSSSTRVVPNSSLSSTLPLSTSHSNHSSGYSSGSLFSKTTGTSLPVSATSGSSALSQSHSHLKSDPPLERIYSPIVTPSSRKGSMTSSNHVASLSNHRPNTTR